MRDLYFVLLPNVLLLDFAGPWHAFQVANIPTPYFRLHAVAPEASVNIGHGLGLTLTGVEALPEVLPPGAVVVIPGGHAYEAVLKTPAGQAVLDWLARVFTPEHCMVTVCSGALVAARAGLLADRRCTTHHVLTERLARLEPRARVVEDRIFVHDGNVCTSAGFTAGLDLALYLIGEWCGQPVALAAARQMVVYLRRSGDDPQLSPWLSWRNHLHPKVHAVQDRICRHPEQRWSLEQLADTAHLSVRHLTRVFRDTTGISIHDYQRRISLDHARRLLAETGHSIERVAELSGFGTARTLRRAWQAEFGQAPSEMRAS